MTVATELTKVNQRLEYILCVEGIGWPVDEADLSQKFVGDIFVTADLDGDTSAHDTLLMDSGTIHYGLRNIGNITDNLDPRVADYQPGGMTVDIIDVDDWLTQNFSPQSSTQLTELSATTQYTSLNFRMLDGSSLSNGDVVWIGATECIKLGGKSSVGGVEYDFTACTRGYLGTRRGRQDRHLNTSGPFLWPSAAAVFDGDRHPSDRRCVLYVHVPGEATANVKELWRGKLKSYRRSDNAAGVRVSLNMTADPLFGHGRIHKAIDWKARFDYDIEGSGSAGESSYGSMFGGVAEAAGYSTASTDTPYSNRMRANFHQDMATQSDDGRDHDFYGLGIAYRYRNVDGGTHGMASAWDVSANPQALDASNTVDDDILMSQVMVDGKYTMTLVKRATAYDADPPTQDDKRIVFTERVPQSVRDALQDGEDHSVRFLLGNINSNSEFNRYTINNRVTRNPIDILLCHILSMDYELAIGSATTGSTTSNVEFASTPLVSEDFTGKAVISVEQANTFGESRTIGSNDADTITLATGDLWSNAPTVNNEYQVRNSIYDVLPFGWGLGMPSELVDVDAFEKLRNERFEGVDVSRFVVGTESRTDIWEWLHESIMKPFGIMVYVNRQTGKLTPKYMGQGFDNLGVDSYVTVAANDIISASPLDYGLSKAIGKMIVELRERSSHVVNNARTTAGAILPRNKTKAIPISNDEAIGAFGDNGVDDMSLQAPLNTIDDTGSDFIISRAWELLAIYNIAPPTVTLELPPSYIFGDDSTPALQAGTWCYLNWADAVNPYSTARGWTNQPARCISTDISLSGSASMRATFELYKASSVGLIAPSVTTTSKGSDGSGDYFVVDPDEQFYLHNTNATGMWEGFAVGDLIELRDKEGALKEDETIQAFGSNQATTPASASDDRIYVTGTIASSIATGDYITFQEWSGSNTTNMDDYAAYATSAGALSGGATPKKFG